MQARGACIRNGKIRGGREGNDLAKALDMVPTVISTHQWILCSSLNVHLSMTTYYRHITLKIINTFTINKVRCLKVSLFFLVLEKFSWFIETFH